MNQLLVLDLSDRNDVDLSVLDETPLMQELSLRNIPGLVSIDDIASVTDLRILDLTGCEYIHLSG